MSTECTSNIVKLTISLVIQFEQCIYYFQHLTTGNIIKDVSYYGNRLSMPFNSWGFVAWLVLRYLMSTGVDLKAAHSFANELLTKIWFSHQNLLFNVYSFGAWNAKLPGATPMTLNSKRMTSFFLVHSKWPNELAYILFAVWNVPYTHKRRSVNKIRSVGEFMSWYLEIRKCRV